MRKSALIGAFTFSVLAFTFIFGGTALAETENQTEEKNEPIMVVVERGDTLSKIAKDHETTYVRIFDANENIKHPDVIYPGDELRIPEDEEELARRELPAPPAPAVRQSQPQSRATRQQTATPTAPAPAVASGSVWDRLAQCESGGNWHINTGNGYYGGLQFLPSTWRGVGGTGLPHQHSREEQIKRAEILLARAGWGQWPACSKKLGLR